MFDCEFTAIVSYGEYESDAYNKLHEDIIKTWWANNILQYLIDIMFVPYRDESEFSDLFRESRELTYLVFQILACPQNLYIDWNVFTKPWSLRWKSCIDVPFIRFSIFDMDHLEKRLNSKDAFSLYVMNFVNPFMFIKNIFGAKKEFIILFDKYIQDGSDIDGYRRFIGDIQNIPWISEEFKDCIISAKLKNWKPTYMTAEAHTQYVNFVERKEKLWTHRKIEENATDDKPVSLKVTKKFKY